MRLATQNDLWAIQRLYETCSKNTQQKYNLDHWTEPFDSDGYKFKIEDKLVYINDEATISYILETRYPHYFHINDGYTYRYLKKMMVHPKLQDQGWGSKILQDIEDSLDVDVLRMDYRSEFVHLRNFYVIKSHYTVIGIGYIGDMEVTLIEKHLNKKERVL